MVIKKKTIGEKIKFLRQKCNMSQRELADTVGVSQPYIAALERNLRKQPSGDIVIKLAQVFNVPVEYLSNENLIELESFSGILPLYLQEFIKNDKNFPIVEAIFNAKGELNVESPEEVEAFVQAIKQVYKIIQMSKKQEKK